MRWIAFIAVLLLYVSALADSETFVVSDTSSHDAGDKNGSVWSISYDETELGWWDANSERYLFVVTDVDIPQASTITTAKIEIWVTTGHTGTPSFVVYGEDVDESAVWSTRADMITRLASNLTTANTIVSNFNPIPQNRYRDIATVTSIVQEIVDRGGWTSGNRMGFFCLGGDGGSNEDMNLDQNDGGDGHNAKLYVEWTAPAAGGPPVPRESPEGGSLREGPAGGSPRETP